MKISKLKAGHKLMFDSTIDGGVKYPCLVGDKHHSNKLLTYIKFEGNGHWMSDGNKYLREPTEEEHQNEDWDHV